MMWLIGAGPMAQAYYKVLQQLQQTPLVIGRSDQGCQNFRQQTGAQVVSGGLELFLKSQPDCATIAIVAVNVVDLYPSCLALLHYGVKHILLEKPGALYQWQLDKLRQLAEQQQTIVLIGYNRRFYAGVQHARKQLKDDGGVLSFYFEMTEWSHQIEATSHPDEVKARWLIANTAHIIDLAFYLGGTPKQMNSLFTGSLPWHPSAAVMTGAGVSESGALFSYQGNWQSAGRWALELSSAQRRFQFMPLEQVQQQLRGTVVWQPVPPDNNIDHEFKAGLYAQVKAFLAQDPEHFCDLTTQIQRLQWYEQMANYPSSAKEPM
ncbi:Gfo/Idh/MocA family oxidoreductase [Rheinheimera sp. 1928-s]|uniref:Gfo/Idh/MocA family protein n=1 Tax=Rheinheimera sp. 1928-s TaxID=3033803 RepID=UPI0026137465|nr:Gfo/Idh/MocA family oxidoreductase [Rheinheimera sp. 1928-s]MDF3125829.1 Gfo/Idh/MocA family oxidoreductase [Rheinheimera sp. 1928-s]